jgi:hypothetical protein
MYSGVLDWYCEDLIRYKEETNTGLVKNTVDRWRNDLILLEKAIINTQ